jgi:hypothetical protein
LERKRKRSAEDAMGKIVTVWNGECVAPMDEARALDLESRGLVQIMTPGMDAKKLKPANAFGGYKTRMMRADAALFETESREQLRERTRRSRARAN